ncbi:MAG: hypothetical protein QOC98_897 [Frankiaceae bacterium]|nr:hypothetical protein [Frankiaceae bacterium]
MTVVFPRRPGRGGEADEARETEAFIPLARLATLSETLAAQPLGPSAAFREQLRARLLAEATATLAPSAPGSDTRGLAAVRVLEPSRRRPALRGAAAGLALVLAGGGVAAAAAEHSLPGETLHPLKRFTESVRLAADPHRNSPSRVLREIDVRLTELEQSSRLGTGAAPTGVPFDRWPAMEAALADVESDLGRLAPRASDPAVRDALAQQRQLLVSVLPTLPAQQQPAVQRLVAMIDAMVLQPGTVPPGAGQPGTGGVLSLPTPVSGSPGPAIARGAGATIGSAVPGATSAARPGNRSAASTHRTARSASSGTTAGRSTRVVATRTRAATVDAGTSSRTGTSATASRRVTTSRGAPLRKTVTVTVTTVTTRVTGPASRPSSQAPSGPASTTLPSAGGSATSGVSRTVSTTTRTVSTTVETAQQLTKPLGGR